MLTLKLKREKENFNQNFDYIICVDKQEITRLKNGEEKTIDINENAQYLEAKINYGSSEKLQIKDLKSNQIIEVTGNKFRNKYFKYSGALLPIIGFPFIINDKYELIKIITGVLFFAYLIVILYIGLFQKRKWLNLQLIK